MSKADIQPVRKHYERLDQATARFASATGIACPPGCGRCCLWPEVSAAEVEMLPMAAEILRRGEAQAWLERLDARGDERRCPVYEPEPGDPARGRCGIYEARPLVCRLFCAFSGRRDKHGAPKLPVHCPVHVETLPARVDAARAAVAAGLPIPILHDEATALRALDPSVSSELLPIGPLRRALAKLALAARLEGEAGPAPDCDVA